jgi:hypothetical protein
MSTGAKIGVGCGGCLGLSAVGFLGLALLGALLPDSEPSAPTVAASPAEAEAPADETEGAAAEPEEAAHPGLGEVVEHGDWEITVVSIDYGVPTGDLESMFAEEPSGQWVVVELEATNISSAPSYFVSDDQVLMDASGSMYSYDVMSSEGIDMLDQVNPGGSVAGQLAFDVPEDTEISHMIVNGETFLDDGVRVNLE